MPFEALNAHRVAMCPQHPPALGKLFTALDTETRRFLSHPGDILNSLALSSNKQTRWEKVHKT